MRTPGGIPSVQGRRTAMQWARRWLPALLLVGTVVLAYARVWHCGFIWDDDDHLTRNPCIVGPLGFGAIWTSSKAVYYPLVLTSFWIQHQLWGLNPLPYHVVDVALHSACAVLLWAVLRRLRVSGAWLGAAIWALHPVQAESAAWITEQKNTQSCLFYLLSILFFLRWYGTQRIDGQKSGSANPAHYALALIFATAAILSKSSTVMLPVVLALCCWWVDDRWRWRNTLWLIPFLAVSMAASLWTIWEQKYANHALGPEWSQTMPERIIIAGKDAWFYLEKLAWPHPLTFIYPRWTVNASNVSDYIPAAAVVIAMGILWVFRSGWSRPIFFAAAYFIVSLFPVLGFFNVYFFRYSFVGDHFQYLASIGPLALAGAGIANACGATGSSSKQILYPAFAGLVIAVLGTLTWLQCGVYYSLETLWRDTLADNPNAFLAHYNLADVLVHQGKLEEAVAHYQKDLALEPGSIECAGNLANVFVMQGRLDEAIAEYEKLVPLAPENSQVRANLGAIYLREGRVTEAINDAKEAVELARRSEASGKDIQSVTGPLSILAAAYAKAGWFEDAAKTATNALQTAQAEQAGPQVIATLRQNISAYQAALTSETKTGQPALK